MSVQKLSRRAFIASAAALGAGLAVAACAPKPVEPPAKETAPAEAAPTTAAESPTAVPPAPSAQAKVQLVEMLDPGEDVVMTAAVDQFNKDNPDIQVTWENPPWEGFAEKIITMVAGGAAPDICFTHSTWVPLFAEQDASLPLDAFIERDADFGIDDVYATVAEYFMYKGKRYGVPTTSWPTVTYYNKTLFDQLGVPTPDQFIKTGLANATDEWTWDKALELALRLTQGEGVDKTFGISGGYGAAPTSLTHLSAIVFSNGGEVWTEDLKKTRMCEAPAVEAVKFQVELITKHHVAPLAAEAEGIPDGVNSGRYAMWMWNRSEVLGFKNVKFELGMSAYPRGPKGRILRDGPKAYGILKSTKVAEQTWRFYKYMAGPKPGVLGGQEFLFKSQRTIPTRKSLTASPVFLDNLLPWESKEVLQDAAARVRCVKYPARYSEIDKLYSEAWDKSVLGQLTPEAALQEFCPRADEMLA